MSRKPEPTAILSFFVFIVVFSFCALPTGSGSATALLAGVVSQTPNRVGRSGLASRRWLGLHTSREGEPSVFMYVRHNPSCRQAQPTSAYRLP